ncbi:MAG TPA: cation-translocating P-type ATPase [Candidatus Deferrimicrobiaceae bacterium]|nr:cation-translocating P-type ATPase [Candidatus Deferrimicrobiaceae bacterium]
MSDTPTASLAEGGLTTREARRRLREVGPNRVAEQAETPLWRLALAQFRSLVVLLLLAAAALAWMLGERPEAVAILAALLLNAAIGFGSEWRARVSLARLRALARPQALVRRDGYVRRIDAAELVPGDLIILEAGAAVPADARLLRAAALQVNESTLTGESAAVWKDAAARPEPEAPLAERPNMVFLGTTVLSGSGAALVTATGPATELGRIGRLVAAAGSRTTPLERQVEALGRRLIVLVLGICAVVGLAGILHGEPVGLMLETAISLAVAAVPEGLPAVVSLALAAGLWRLARRGALVRRLAAVETLGSTTVICADKTGTMTENQMTVTSLRFGGRRITVGGGGRSTAGSFVDEAGGIVAPLADAHLTLLLTAAALCNDAALRAGPDGLHLNGDPTESALLVAAVKAGLDPAGLARAWPRRREIPFDPASRLMATFHVMPGAGPVLLAKGAPSVIVERSARVHSPAGPAALTEDDRVRLLEDNRAMAREGLRVLALAWRPVEAIEGATVEELTFLGFAGFVDPVRPEVADAIAACREAGIRTIMLTGDQQLTALTVGRQLGLEPEAIRSRVTPEGKLDLVAELQSRGEIVAMTGDGVNDAPALVRADIGVAMGRHGTDVAREAADLVLTDDNFATIVEAVKEGRVIYANLRKVIHFLFSCNLSEILTIFVAILLGYPTPLLPLQILWVNLVTDILPAMALIRDPADDDAMQRPPRDPAEALVTRRSGARMLGEGALLAAGVLSTYLWTIWREGPGAPASTMAFTALVLIHPFQAMSCRSDRLNWWQLRPNPWIPLSLLALFGLQWLAIEWGPLARLLGTRPLTGADWLVLALGVLWPVALLEAIKAWGRFTTLRLGYPTVATHDGPPSARTSRKH